MNSLFYKRGVTETGAFARRAMALERQQRGWWPFSYQLLWSLEQSYSAEDEPLLERLYSSLEAGTGVYKITKRHRFDRLDAILRDEIQTRFASVEKIRIHDGAASSAVTSIDLFNEIQSVGSVELIASDYFHRLWLVDEGPWTIAFDEFGNALQYTGWGMVLPARRKEFLRFPVNRVTQLFVAKRIVGKARDRLDKFRSATVDVEGVRSVMLFHPEAVALAKADTRFRLQQHDLFQPLNEAVHIFRVMNFLTARHLDNERIRNGLSAMLKSVVPGGLLVIGRTRDESDGALCVSGYEVMDRGRVRKAWQLDEPWEAEFLMSEYLKPGVWT